LLFPFCYFCRSPRLVWKVFSFTFCLRCIFAIWHHFVWHGQQPHTHGAFMVSVGQAEPTKHLIRCAPRWPHPVRIFLRCVPLCHSGLVCSIAQLTWPMGCLLPFCVGLCRLAINSLSSAPGGQKWCCCHKFNCQLHFWEWDTTRISPNDWLTQIDQSVNANHLQKLRKTIRKYIEI